jgi:hypothetical protein
MTAPVPPSGKSAEPAVNRIRAKLARSQAQWIGVKASWHPGRLTLSWSPICGR